MAVGSAFLKMMEMVTKPHESGVKGLDQSVLSIGKAISKALFEGNNKTTGAI